jgi:serine/threonine-protein kinase RsbT
MKSEIRIHIRKENDIMPAAMRAGEYCREVGFTEAGWRMISTVVSELAHNIVKYAQHGSIQVKTVRGKNRRGVEVIAVDTGPGIPDVDRAMEDHYSSSGTLGLGLPGVKRMMDDFDLQSTRGKGTRVLVRKWI